jgi:hypothetical protein
MKNKKQHQKKQKINLKNNAALRPSGTDAPTALKNEPLRIQGQ